jgi:hypothetical protein
MGWGSGTYWRALEVGGMRGLTMCGDAGQVNSILRLSVIIALQKGIPEYFLCVSDKQSGLILGMRYLCLIFPLTLLVNFQSFLFKAT